MTKHKELGDNHEVLSRDPYCSGYMDSFGKWNNGFACPKLEEGALFCCGTITYRYCCTAKTQAAQKDVFSQNLPLLLGVVFGSLVTIVLVITVICFFCESCRAHRKRAGGGGPMYRIHASSVNSGVANMYSSGSSESLDDLENRNQELNMVIAHGTCNVSTIGHVPKTFSYDPPNRVSYADSVGGSSVSVSTTTENERQNILFDLPLNSQHLYRPSRYPPAYPGGASVLDTPTDLPPPFTDAPDLSDMDINQCLPPPPPGAHDEGIYRSTKF